MPKKTEREDPLGFFNIHSVAKLQKNLGGPFGLVRYCMLRGKPFWFSSLGQQVKFCRTILVTSGGLKEH